MMMAYSLGNPSDPYTFLAPDKEVAALLCLLQGGQVNATPIDADGDEDFGNESEVVPFFMFGGSKEYFESNFGRDPETSMKARLKELGEACLSVLYGSARERDEYKETLELIDDPAKREQFAENWHNKRSSLNDFGGYFREMGAQILKAVANADTVGGNDE